MKQLIFLMFFFISAVASGQSLKEALYGGKLKNDAGSVIRKTDDLSTKIDTTTRKPAQIDSAQLKAALPMADAAIKKPVPAGEVTTVQSVPTNAASAGNDGAASVTAEAIPAPVAATVAPKDNNTLWKDFMAAFQPAIKSDVLPSKKVKKGIYSVMVSYTIDTAGQTAVTDVFVAPENDYLKDQVKNRLTDTPRMAPVLNSTGAARKVTKRYSFTVTKD